jgi:DeoR/GlpR family transcriptional regulator of sugar metabolism
MNERHRQILDKLRKLGYMRVTDLASDLDVSDMTIRRDLEKLEWEGYLSRTHGGAHIDFQPALREMGDHKPAFYDQKKAIGLRAAALIQQDESIFIDSGDIAAIMASSLADDQRLTVVTNSLTVAQVLMRKVTINTILIGGNLRTADQSLTGPLAEESINRFKYTRAFLETDGINLSEGFSVATLEEIPIKRAAASKANEVIILADRTKFSREVLALFLGIREVDRIITDWEVGEEQCRPLIDRGIDVLVAQKTGDDTRMKNPEGTNSEARL